MFLIVISFVLLGGIPAYAAQAAPIQWIDGDLDISPHLAKHFGIQNNTGHPIDTIEVDCGFFNANGHLVATGSAVEFKIAPGDTAYDTVEVSQAGSDGSGAKCRWFKP